MKPDIMIKRAQYIAKNIEILQEFLFANPETRLRKKQSYNSPFTGSPIWEACMSENSWNRSVSYLYRLSTLSLSQCC